MQVGASVRVPLWVLAGEGGVAEPSLVAFYGRPSSSGLTKQRDKWKGLADWMAHLRTTNKVLSVKSPDKVSWIDTLGARMWWLA